MAEGPIPAIQQSNTGSNVLGNAGSIASFLQVLLGKSATTTTSGGNETSQTLLSTDAENALIKRMLESNSGLAAVASGAKAAGGYNSSTQQLQINDLLSRVAGNVAVAGAPTVKTASPTTSKQSTDPVASLTQLLGGLAVSTVANKALKASGINETIDKQLADIFKPKSSQFTSDSATGEIFNSSTGGELLTDATASATSGAADVTSGAVSSAFDYGGGEIITNALTDSVVSGAVEGASLSGVEAGVAGTEIAGIGAGLEAGAGIAAGAEVAAGFEFADFLALLAFV